MDLPLVQEGLDAVDAKLIAVIDSEIDLLNEASIHILKSGGKRLRPQIGFLSYIIAGGKDIHDAVSMAAAIEMVHTATLVHDDINDHSLLRRGRPAVHARWGRTFALLTGDYMFTKVYELMAPYGGEYNVIMADACTRLVEGETLQAVSAKAGTIDRETYKRIVSLKTASLFEASARMGAMLGNGDDSVVNALAEYAFNLGIAFQIVDDMLDIIGDPDALGKPVGLDVAQQRGVLVAEQERPILTLQTNGEETATLDEPQDPIEKMMARLRDTGAIEAARLQAMEMATRAREALAVVPPSAARDELDSLIDSVLERDH
ncbi:MAG: polyprenyl synthetase family protein [Chloroflexota bacterium]